VVESVFTPDPEEVQRCQDLVASMNEADAESGRGAIRVDGEMVDLAHVRRAEAIIERAETFDVGE
jgi:citrate lyase beta subunit